MLKGQMVVFTGAATAGKTRTAVHLIKQLFPNRFLYAPTGVTSLSTLLEKGHNFIDAVVWLDDIERYFGENGIDLGVLSRLCPTGRTDVVVVATLRHHEFLKHGLSAEVSKATSKDGDTKPHPAGTDLLAHLLKLGRLFKVSTDLSPTEIDSLKKVQARAVKGDTRLLDASKSGRGFGEHLGAGAEMMNRWVSKGDTLEKVGAAVISAAVDARRAGYSGPIPIQALSLLTSAYLPKAFIMRSDSPSPLQGMEWAACPVSGTETSSCLIPHSDGGYRAEDYLADRADTNPSPLAGIPINASVWPTILGLANANEAAHIGYTAHTMGIPDIAKKAWRQAADSGNSVAMLNLGLLLFTQGDKQGAYPWFSKAIGTGDTSVMLRIGDLMAHHNFTTEAEPWYRKAAEAGNTTGMANLGATLHIQGNATEAEPWYRKAAEDGDTTAMNNLARLLESRGHTTEAQTWRCKAAQTEDLHTNGTQITMSEGSGGEKSKTD